MRIPVLCYHSQIISANNYCGNGHIALQQDLTQLTESGWRVVPLSWVVEWQRGERDDADLKQAVAISFDDGMLSDFSTVEHPEFGTLQGFLPILEAFQQSSLGNKQPQLHATAFVIVSDQARRDIDQACHGAIGWDKNKIWHDVKSHPLLSLENHSWDHNHETCNESAAYPQGTFSSVHNFDLCEHEVRRAAEHLRSQFGIQSRIFAYPYGQASHYISDQYLPQHSNSLGIEAAFTTAGEYVDQQQSPWLLPRFVHGYHWRSPADLAQLLSASQ